MSSNVRNEVFYHEKPLAVLGPTFFKVVGISYEKIQPILIVLEYNDGLPGVTGIKIWRHEMLCMVSYFFFKCLM